VIITACEIVRVNACRSLALLDLFHIKHNVFIIVGDRVVISLPFNPARRTMADLYDVVLGEGRTRS
jgi:hypothetical protein